MANRRSQNWVQQQRIDVPHLRSIESAVRNDFDELIGSFAIGESQSYILRGFELNLVGAIGSSASSLQMVVDSSSLFHGKSNESGTFFQVPTGTPNEVLSSTTNSKVQGSFTPSSLNYIGLEFIREVDNSTIAQVFLWNPTNKNEISKTIPLAETLDYEVFITSSIWASNVLPIAIVETDGSNNVISVEDSRPMLFRLGTAGTSTPDPFHVYPWLEGRQENPFITSNATSPFDGGDKQLLHFKDWADAVMSQIVEIKGTPYWYSENTGGSIIKLRGDLANLQMTGSGKYSHSDSTGGQINWDSDILLNYIGSRLQYKIEANAATTDILLADDQVAYFTIVRGVDITPKLIWTNSSAIISSVGAVAWTSDILAGDYIKVGVEGDSAYFEIQSVDSVSQVTLTSNFDGTSTGSSGTPSKYAYGTYQTSAAPSTDRHLRVVDRKDVPFTEDTYWLFLRNDNGSAIAKVYIRGSSGGELEQGEDREISDNTSLDILEYVGSASESDNTPDYTNSIVTSTAEVTTFTFPAAAALTSGEYFTINSALDIEKFYTWANKDAADGNPTPGGLQSIEVAIAGADNNIAVAAAFAAALDAKGEFNVVDNLNGTITVTNSQFGATTDATNIDMGAGFSIANDVQGVGSFNHVIVDDENLTKSIKRLDEAVGDISNSLDVAQYEEKIEIVNAGAVLGELNGPLAAGTNITIPLNTRNSDIQETYTIGDADINIYVNGHLQCVGRDYLEIGTLGDASVIVNFNFILQIGYVVSFEKPSNSGSSGGSGSSTGVNLGSAQSADVFKQNVGSTLQFRRLAEGPGMTIAEDAEKIVFSATPILAPATVVSIVGVDYTLLSGDDVALVQNSGVNVTITLPDASTSLGKKYDIKKTDIGNNLFIASILGQTLDNIDITASPHAVSIQYENVTVISDGANWWIL